MRDFQYSFEIRKRSFISAFSICMTAPLSRGTQFEPNQTSRTDFLRKTSTQMFDWVLNVPLLGLVGNSCSFVSHAEDELFELIYFIVNPQVLFGDNPL